ncbi:hypothetical protein GcM3_c14969o13 [Golovinomyces cichoracearum]|uniref:Uncharacterized protein n=1 Tax=Golovinomyces cichoracearum TaxID=62708 RepID=A0A420J2Q2_9PEZI|nr:hypothetical protein GcM3_c14969o13 [Golovinomyces cichoracearum]
MWLLVHLLIIEFRFFSPHPRPIPHVVYRSLTRKRILVRPRADASSNL